MDLREPPIAAVLTLLLSGVAGSGTAAGVAGGRVTDATTGAPLPSARITSGEVVVGVGPDGRFRLRAPSARLGVRAPGYRRVTVDAGNGLEVRLIPFRPRALYLSALGVGHRGLRQHVLALLEQTEMNALVIDVKDDRGRVPYPSTVPLAREIGADRLESLRNAQVFLAALHQRGIYLIARVVVFKDDVLAGAHPELAVRAGGVPWRDPEGVRWVDPFRQEPRQYALAIAQEAADLGFDEIQFDYLRFPDAPGLRFSKGSHPSARVSAIRDFLRAARERLAPANVFLAADVFGYACWNEDDVGIGQSLRDLAPLVDYVSPMLYPSAFQQGIPGHQDPVSDAFDVVRLSLEQAAGRTGLDPERFRPWLQAFRDYAFDHQGVDAALLCRQTRAAEAFGTDGWMLWNARNVYDRNLWSPWPPRGPEASLACRSKAPGPVPAGGRHSPPR